MKKQIKKILPLSMAGIMLFGSIAPIFATVSDKHVVTSNSNQQTEVIYNQESNFEVTVPKLIDLGSDKLTNYLVSISGDISSDEVIKVVPDESFLMKDISGATNLKDDVTATVTQDKTEWIFNEFETKGNGTVSAPDLTAGTWEGKFNFNISLDSLEEAVTFEAGLYDANGVMLCSWEEAGIDASFDYDEDSSEGDYYYRTAETSGYYVIANKYPETTKIVIPEGIEYIGDYAFRKCENVVEFVIPKTVKSFGADSFRDTKWLNDQIEATDDYVIVNNALIDGTKATGDIIVPEGIIEISSSAFESNDNITSVQLPSTLKRINNWAFWWCDNLAGTVEIPNGVEYIGIYAFGGTQITSVTIPESVTTIMQAAFDSTPWLENKRAENPLVIVNGFLIDAETATGNVNIPEGVHTIVNHAFSWNENMESVTLPNTVTYIGSRAFANTNITNITIPENVTFIEKTAFKGCTFTLSNFINNSSLDAEENNYWGATIN